MPHLTKTTCKSQYLGARFGDLQPFVVLLLFLDQGISQSVKRFGPTKKVASPSLASRSTFLFLWPHHLNRTVLSFIWFIAKSYGVIFISSSDYWAPSLRQSASASRGKLKCNEQEQWRERWRQFTSTFKARYNKFGFQIAFYKHKS